MGGQEGEQFLITHVAVCKVVVLHKEDIIFWGWAVEPLSVVKLLKCLVVIVVGIYKGRE